ncbi:hypothetical protein [uncultured Sneathiella sp.]|mgnify:CR=1 FL=1|uniref:hypothetical protein n=1 Tax=uncultured Sneathiella sp. TaxID=879315 RepID=UPI0030DB1894|tara:strand:+ start:742 stop:945 length:204 start_codon:yes stop_codon:yes gene_type:complete
MARPPLDKRSVDNLEQQLRQLREVYNACSEMSSNLIPTENTQSALERIEEGISAIEEELKRRISDRA